VEIITVLGENQSVNEEYENIVG